MVLASKEFGGSADDRCAIALVLNHFVQPPDDFGVGDVFAVPSEKIVDSVPRCNCDVTGIGCRLLRDDAALEDFGTQFDGLLVDFEKRQAFDGIHAFSRCPGVAFACFLNDQLGYEDGVMALPGIPPAQSELLLPYENQVIRWPGGQEARDCGFEINGGFRVHVDSEDSSFPASGKRSLGFRTRDLSMVVEISFSSPGSRSRIGTGFSLRMMSMGSRLGSKR